MNDLDRHLLTVFGQALECGSPAAQAAYLDRACGNDAELRGRVEALLRAHDDAGGFLGGNLPPTAEGMPPVDPAPGSDGPGTVIGPYKLLQEIGEGGMGTVFMAEQTVPVQRKVALKIIKPGMDSRHVIARFEAERQALALMEHPNIARVLDAGTTENGRPYFVMELVKGVPITRYCDERRLTLKERLELFLPVCQAVQHAHQKGIIHRDLKPSNVLVAEYDDKPVAKVIDFGIAKATGPKLTDRTLFTEVGQVVGTLEYMSPEQAKLNALDIDTRSDIYSLGVLLYELLTGTTPFDRKRLQQAAFDQILRVIREEEPPRPSTRLSGTDELPSIAANRSLEPKKLSGLMRGDLDWIVMKALEKDRNRRYETANGFALDVQRYLTDEPVQACPPSAWYRLRKLTRRNKRAFTAAALVAVALVVGTAVSTWQAVRATQARNAERAAHVALDVAHQEQDRQRVGINAELVTALADVAGLREKTKHARPGDVGPWNQLREALRRAEALAGGELADPNLVAQLHALQAGLKQEDWDQRMVARLEEIRLDVSALIHDEDRVSARVKLPLCLAAFRDYGVPLFELDVAEAARRISASAIRDALIAALEECTVTDQARWNRLLPILRGVQNDPWHRTYYDALAVRDKSGLLRLARQPETLTKPPAALDMFGWQLREAGLPEAAVDLLRVAQRRYPADLWINLDLATHLSNLRMKSDTPEELRRRSEEGLGFMRAAVAASPQNSAVRQLLARYLLESCWRASNGPRYYLDEAVSIFREESLLHPGDGACQRGLGRCLWDVGEREAALAAFRRAIELNPKDYVSHGDLVYYLGMMGDRDGVIAAYRKAIEIDPEQAPSYWFNLSGWLQAKGDLDGAVAAIRKTIELDRRELWLPAYDQLGRILLQKRDLNGAVAAMSKAIELTPAEKASREELAGRYSYLVEPLRQKGDFDAAIAAFHKAIELSPTTISANYPSLGAALLHDKDATFKDVVAAARKGVDACPQHPRAHYQLGLRLQEKRDLLAAIAAYSKAIELDPKTSEWWAARGMAYDERGQWDKAAADWSMALKLNPEDGGGCRYSRALAYRKLGELEKARADFSLALQFNPGHINALCGLTEIHGEMDEWSTVVAVCSRFLERNPKVPEGWVRRGRAYRHLGQWDRAAADFVTALDMSPNDCACQNDLARLLATCPEVKLRDPRKAVQLAQQAVRQMSQVADFWSTLGVAQYRAGNGPATLAALTRAVELRRGGDVVDWLFLAMAHQKLDHRDEAGKWYDRAVEWLEKNGAALAKDPARAEELRDLRIEAEEVLKLKKR